MNHKKLMNSVACPSEKYFSKTKKGVFPGDAFVAIVINEDGE